ncbi:MAG TPA: hypothetical protein DEF45_05045 [Rhodopirellula sp.]|nr:hypothetical protein [Rhodopirellula sp.]
MTSAFENDPWLLRKERRFKKNANQNSIAQMIDPETKAALGVVSTLMRFQGGEKVNFAICKEQYLTNA